MKKENVLLLISVIIFMMGLGAYFFFKQDTVPAVPATIVPTNPATDIGSLPPGSMNPQYGDLNKEQISVADRAIGKLLNSGDGLNPSMITVVSVEEREFSDSSLGCPQPDMMYTQAIVSGYEVVLEANGQQYDYRIGSGDTVLLCEN